MNEAEREEIARDWEHEYAMPLDDYAWCSHEALAAQRRDFDLAGRIPKLRETLRQFEAALREEIDASAELPPDDRRAALPYRASDEEERELRWFLEGGRYDGKPPPTPRGRKIPIGVSILSRTVGRAEELILDLSHVMQDLECIAEYVARDSGVATARELVAHAHVLTLGRAADALAEVTTRGATTEANWRDVEKALRYFGHDTSRLTKTGDPAEYLRKLAYSYRTLVWRR